MYDLSLSSFSPWHLAVWLRECRRGRQGRTGHAPRPLQVVREVGVSHLLPHLLLFPQGHGAGEVLGQELETLGAAARVQGDSAGLGAVAAGLGPACGKRRKNGCFLNL